MASNVDECTTAKRREDGAEHKGDNVDTTLRCRAAFSLVEKWQVVGCGEEADHHEEHGDTCSDLCAAFEELEGHHGAFAHIEFPRDERDQKHAKDDKERDDTLIAPGLCDASPLEGQEERGDHGHADNRTDPIEREPLLECRLAVVEGVRRRWVGGLEEDDGRDGDGAKGQVDVETPSPTDFVGKGASKKGANDGCKSEYAAKAAKEDRCRDCQQGLGSGQTGDVRRVSSLVICARMVRMEMNMPEAPMPWNARPKMRTFMLGATPQMSDPTSKMKMQVR